MTCRCANPAKRIFSAEFKLHFGVATLESAAA